MRALFCIPPPANNARGRSIDRVYGCNYGFDYKPPVHLLAVATYARDVLGWEVRLLDCPAEGIDQDTFEGQIVREGWDVVASWSTYLSAIEDVAAARLFHAARPQTRFVFMGAGATWRPEEFRVGDHSIVLMGEPEHSLRAVAESWAEGRSLEAPPGWPGSAPTGPAIAAASGTSSTSRSCPCPTGAS